MKLSIITVNRNNVDGLRKTIESVVSQTFTDFEYIIIDGASTDGSVEVIKEYAKATLPNGEGLGERLYWVSEPDTGIYNAMNKGILKAKGEYLLFLNSGDWLYSDRVLENVFSLNRNEDFLYGNYSDKTGDIFYTPETLSAYYFYKSTMSQQCVFYKNELFTNGNLFNENYKVASDWEYFLNAFIYENKTYFKLELIVNGQQPGISYDDSLSHEERDLILMKYFPKMVIEDYKLLDSLHNNPFFPYMEMFNKDAKMRRLAKRIIKIFLVLYKRKNQIPQK